MQLRKNQIPALEEGIKYFNEKKPKPALIVAPVAFGKSLVISKLAHESEESIIVLLCDVNLADKS